MKLKKEYTLSELAIRMVKEAQIKKGMRVLEPLAGEGHILEILPKNIEIECYEIDAHAVAILVEKGWHPIHKDFLTVDHGSFDAVVMNPPFTKGQDMEYIIHAFKFLKPGGRLVAISLPSWTMGTKAKQKFFKKFIDIHGTWETITAKTFKGSGTSIEIILIVINKPEL